MTVKEVAKLSKKQLEANWLAVSNDASMLLKQRSDLKATLHASQKREREVFKAMAKACYYITQYSNCRNTESLDTCTRRNCPLLKPVEKPFSDCRKKGKK